MYLQTSLIWMDNKDCPDYLGALNELSIHYVHMSKCSFPTLRSKYITLERLESIFDL